MSTYPEVAGANPGVPQGYGQPMAYPPPGAVPQMVPQVIGASNKWENSLCGCFSDCGTCCWGYWCPCWLFGDTYEKTGNGGCCAGCFLYYLTACFCLQGLVAMGPRQKIRTQNGLEGTDCKACCTYTWCASCAVCQDAREVKFHSTKQQFYTAPATMAPPNQAMYQ